MSLLSEKLKAVENELQPITTACQSEARQIMCFVLKCQLIDLVFEANRKLEINEIDAIDGIVRERLNRKPLQYCLGVQNFYGLDFNVNENVLIPRPETEMLVSFILDYCLDQGLNRDSGHDNLKSRKLLDIGTGSGAIVISLAQKLDHFIFVASDISPLAIQVAQENAKIHDVDQKIEWQISDLFASIEETLFDVIVSNPPYIPTHVDDLEPEVLNYEPHLALFGGDDGLDYYRKIIPQARPYLKSGGLLVFEAGHNQTEAIETIFKINQYDHVGHFEDLNGISRFIYGKKQQTEVDNNV